MSLACLPPHCNPFADLVELAGRVYPDLGDADKQSYFADPNVSPKLNEGRQVPGQWMKGLMGLTNAADVFNYSDQWRGKLSWFNNS
jgi:hypothetical protein